LLAAAIVAAMITVGAFLVIIGPPLRATAYLLCDRFPRLIIISVLVNNH
jgi:manganese/iron transport system permease protein